MVRIMTGLLLLLMTVGCTHYFDTSGKPIRDEATFRFAADETVDSTEAFTRIVSDEDDVLYTLAVEPEDRESGTPVDDVPVITSSRESKGSSHKASIFLESIRGMHRERKGILIPHSMVTMGFRDKRGISSWYVHGKSRSVVRSIMVGQFKLLMGEGLLLGRGARSFYSNPAISIKMSPLRMSPSFSTWNSQQGLAVTLGMRTLTADIAVFEKFLPEAESSPRMILFGFTHQLLLSRLGMAIITPTRRNRGRDDPGTAVHGFALYTGAHVRFAGEVGMLFKQLVGAVRFSLDTPVDIRVRLFRAPDGNAIGDWLETVRRVSSVFQGGCITARRMRSFLRPTMSYISFVQSKPAYSKHNKVFMLQVSGNRTRCWTWNLRATLSESRKITYPTTALMSNVLQEKMGGFRLKGAVTIKGGRLSQTFGLEGRFNRWGHRPDAARLSTALTGRWKRISTVFKISCYTVHGGRPMLISRPGVGSFEVVGWTSGGSGTDVALRVLVQISSSLRLAVYYGYPSMDERITYLGVRWKFER